MNARVPVRLKKEPLLEAVWEARFIGDNPAVGELLLGVIYRAMGDKYAQIERLPAADIPAPIVEQDPSLKYVPKIRLTGDNHAIQIGEHVISLSCRRPYSGWKSFSAEIRTLISVIRNTVLLGRLERFSLKYLDLIESDQPPDLVCLNVGLKLGGEEIHGRPVQLRTEIRENGLIHVVLIASPAEASIPGAPERLTGVLLDIDTICKLGENESWEKVEKCLDMAHMAAKQMFFRLLTSETIERLDPEYEE